MDFPQGTLLSTLTPRSIRIRLAVGVLTLNLFVIFMAVTSLQRSWANHQDRAIATTQNLALVLDRYVSDTFSKADLAVRAVKEELERADAHPVNGLWDLDAFIRRQQERVPGTLALRTTNAQGVIDRGTGTEAGSGISVADRAYFLRLRDDPKAGCVISKPVMGRVVGQWVVILARRLDHPDHRFAGIAYAVIGLDQFAQAFSSLDVGRQGSVALRDLDLGLVSRHPDPIRAGTDIGQHTVSPEFLAFARSGQHAGSYRARTPFDGIQRTVSIRWVSGQPFYIVVGLADHDYLSGWRREAYQELVGILLFIGLTLAASWLIHRTWSRQQADQQRLERLLTEVKTLGGLLPICSACKKIRDDKGYWNQIEAYLKDHTDAEFTHGFCPDCAKEYFSDSSGNHPTI